MSTAVRCECSSSWVFLFLAVSMGFSTDEREAGAGGCGVGGRIRYLGGHLIFRYRMSLTIEVLCLVNSVPRYMDPNREMVPHAGR